jgi:mannose/cellobiose epimerase-like protein (N-acyl-D-glucosamine 2-epimerase family)
MIQPYFSSLFSLIQLGGLTFLTFLLTACDAMHDTSQTIATQWHKQDIAAHLSRWLAIAPTPSGLFVGGFDRQWHPVPSNGTDLTTQGRLIYTMVVGYETTGDQRYLDAAIRGADFLLVHFHDPVHGGFFARVDAGGAVINPAKQAYGHAFALFALSHVARVTKEQRFRKAALSAWHDIDLNLRDADGGFRPDAPRDFGVTTSLRNQNPLMHLFEALLALIDATGDPQASAGAQTLGNFVLYRLLQGQPDGAAYIPEWYDEHWQPLSTREKGGYIDLGHQFEWSHLLVSADRRGLSGLYGPVSERLLKYALKVGYDDVHGGVFNRAYPDGSVDRDKIYWGQAEGLRALMVAATDRNRSDLWPKYSQTLEFIKANFVDDVNGGWWPRQMRNCSSANCNDAQPEPYHMVGMDLLAIRLSQSTHSN